MKECIEKTAALDICQKEYEERLRMADYCGDTVAWNIGGAIKSIPTADVVEVRHGRWIPSESDFDDDDTLFDVEDWCDWQCSVCREDICYEDPMERRFLPKFCPNCGARMDKEDEHE